MERLFGVLGCDVVHEVAQVTFSTTRPSALHSVSAPKLFLKFCFAGAATGVHCQDDG